MLSRRRRARTLTSGIPTLEPETLRQLGGENLYYFSGVPDSVRDTLVKHKLCLDANESEFLQKSKIVHEAFAKAFSKVCRKADQNVPDSELAPLTWSELGKIFKDTNAIAKNPDLLSDSLRNPATVESLIWEKLNDKLGRISRAFREVMDEPEDLLQLVLGMSDQTMFRKIFSEAERVPRESINDWFEKKTAKFGGADALNMVQELVGNAAKFNFKEVSDRIPRVDLPDLQAFLEVALALNGKRPKDDGEGFSFLTPDPWKVEYGVSADYRGMRFDRGDKSPDAAKKLLGVGHKVIAQALRQAKERDALIASLPSSDLETALIVFRVQDRVTGMMKATTTVLVGVQGLGDGGGFCLVKDWELLLKLNGMPLRKTTMRDESQSVSDPESAQQHIENATAFLNENFCHLDHPFEYPVAEFSGDLWPL